MRMEGGREGGGIRWVLVPDQGDRYSFVVLFLTLSFLWCILVSAK
jgi:hypothetical protein